MDLNALLVDLVTSPWVPLVVFAVCVIDGFFPPIPSEATAVAALAAVLTTGDAAQAALLVGAAASGAIVGDSIAYALGRRIGLDRYAWMRRDRIRRIIDWTRDRVHRSPATLILVARYIPVGRVAVNATAGASRLPYRRFLALSIAAGVAWAAMCLGIAAASAAWLKQPLLASAVAVVVMIGVGLVVDAIARRRMPRPAVLTRG